MANQMAAIVIASVIWSLHPALISRFRQHIAPITYTAIRAIAAVMFLLFLSLFNRVGPARLDPMVMAIIVLSAVLGPGIGDAAYTRAVQLIGGSLAVVISYTYMFIAQAIAVAFLGEELSTSTLIGTVLAFIGVVTATLRSPENSSRVHGIAYASVASVSWGTASSMLKLILKYIDVLTLTVIRLAVIALFFLPVGFLTEGVPKKNSIKALVILSIVNGILGWGIGMYLFIYSINTIGVSVTTMATALTPVLAQIMTKLLAKELPSKNNIVGALVISAGIAVSSI